MKNLIRLHFLIIIVFKFSVSFAQENISTLTGQILDKKTSEPIPFVSIYIEGQPIGTTTNDDGFFIFHIPHGYEASNVIISIIGYQTISKQLDTFIENEQLFLSSETVNLDEVTITVSKKKKLSAKQIVKKAYSQIKNNYPTRPYLLEGYVRDLQKEDKRHVEYLECAAKFLYQGNSVKREPLIELVEVKSNYLSQKNKWNEQWDRKNSLIDLVEDDFIRFDYGPIKGKKGWKYEIEAVLPYDDGFVYKIKGIDKPYQNATLFIDTKTFAFVRMELTRQSVNGRSWSRKLSNGALQVYYNVIFEYQEYKGKMYLKYQKEEDTWKIYDGLESTKLLFTKYPKKELFINNIIIDTKDYPFNRNMDSNTSIENQAKSFNTKFWWTYNIPKQTEEQSKIISELKKQQD
ncbi:carboxypeptidase-like regulatory domain-containing protein [Spongiivirga citrea]|uniref:Carboxypeptidase-like regulatory domain-containing protein n=1 Tax=Spongiivirga citrea TaxID=1481457 RepID=A0A6M0CHI4_9FLAO|nr:carboxypeptidase-like regulatory domain-containing protein [Spongiivirga citrea]NER17315.1 hypothetical protein [Spongiivirga citrea]